MFEKTLVLEGDVYSVEMMDTSGSHMDSPVHQKVLSAIPLLLVLIGSIVVLVGRGFHRDD